MEWRCIVTGYFNENSSFVHSWNIPTMCMGRVHVTASKMTQPLILEIDSLNTCILSIMQLLVHLPLLKGLDWTPSTGK